MRLKVFVNYIIIMQIRSIMLIMIFWGLVKFSISGKQEMYPEKNQLSAFFSNPNSNAPVLLLL